MPIFRLSKMFGIGRNLKAFLNLEGGLTRGTVPDLKRYHDLENIVEEQRKTLETKDQRAREYAGDLSNTKRQLKAQTETVFQLRNELDAMNELVESTKDTQPANALSRKPKVGALPDFVVIGAMRCGTSQFYRLLVTQHPNIQRAAMKEIHYFDRPERFDKGIEWYRRCFPPPKWTNGQRSITGEATPKYLSDPLVPERMSQVIPNARLIALLRNPVDRAYSHYQLSVRRGQETRSFEEALEEEAGQPSKLLTRGIYVDQLLRWQRFFDDEQMLIIKSEDFFKHTTDTLKRVQDFLDLPYWKLELRSRKTSPRTEYRYPAMTPTTRRRLEAYFEPHNQRLYEHLGQDFGW